MGAALSLNNHVGSVNYNKAYIEQLAINKPNINYAQDKEFIKYLVVLEIEHQLPMGTMRSYMMKESS